MTSFSELNTLIQAKATASKSKHLDVFNTAVLYMRDYQEFEYGPGNTQLPPKKLIFSTNLAGRGTDIKLKDSLIEAGGLHVIIVFLPENVRIEEQAYGRAARCGEPGSAQIIIYDEKEMHADISRMKIHRNALEKKRIHDIVSFYRENIEIEEKCFEQFSVAFQVKIP